MEKVINILVSAIMLLLVTSCANTSKHHQITSDDYLHNYPHTLLTKEQMKEDLDFLSYSLKNTYIGSYFPKMKEQTKKAIMELNSYKIENPLKAKDFCSVLNKKAKSIKDSHFRISYLGKSCTKRVKANFLGESLAGKRPWTVELKGKKLFIAMRTMNTSLSNDWTGFLAKVKQTHKESDHIFFDLRGNLGGGTGVSSKMLDILAEKSVPSAFSQKMSNRGAISLQMHLNMLNSSSTNGKYRKSLISELELNKKKYKLNHIVNNSETQRKYLLSSIDIGKKITVVVDNQCASACEMFLMQLRFFKNVKIYGDRTSGALHTGETGYFLLPKSNILITMPISAFSYHSDEYFEGIGISPDVQFENREEVEYLIKIIVNNFK